MSDTYKFTFKRRFFKKSIKAKGHRYDREIDRMDVYHEDGSITSIARWSQCTLYLGIDWVLFTKKQMEKEAGQPVNLA